MQGGVQGCASCAVVWLQRVGEGYTYGGELPQQLVIFPASFFFAYWRSDMEVANGDHVTLRSLATYSIGSPIVSSIILLQYREWKMIVLQSCQHHEEQRSKYSPSLLSGMVV